MTKKFGVVAFGLLMLFTMIGMAQAQTSITDHAALVSIGNNVAACNGPNNQGGSFAPIGFGNKGVVNVQYNEQQKRFKVNVSVHDAQPNTTYDVDIRCWIFGQHQAIGQLKTNAQGTGTFEIDLWIEKDPAMANFYIDIAVPPPGGAGAGGYGDTYIAGPLNVYNK
jgi:hypothetical protein